MSVFGSIMNKIFHHGSSGQAQGQAQSQPAQQSTPQPAQPQGGGTATMAPPTQTAAPAQQSVDVGGKHVFKSVEARDEVFGEGFYIAAWNAGEEQDFEEFVIGEGVRA